MTAALVVVAWIPGLALVALGLGGESARFLVAVAVSALCSLVMSAAAVLLRSPGGRGLISARATSGPWP
ncbi:hypothetical protein [Microbispora sp. ATCC PTA-5024]|uniref:hypothetical protein n=1 Tax=Microbispora sp. ATCC PTA-5024 TaxID=316330 RepID=UPI0003DCA450|nr:hypothetical protein [Microbispora sp. ATCC PTA-5024]ETK35960.1 hypothetical protein MPTA5024_11615 [Microbispora sp. ATCC PTA-5024]